MFYIIAIPLTILILVFLGLAISVINLWVRALFAEAPVRIRDLIGMKLRRVPPTQVVLTYISAVKAGLNMTTGMGGDLILGNVEQPLPPGPGTDMAGASERMQPIAECLPEICTLDCGTMNFAEADYVMTNTPGMLRTMGAAISALGVQTEIEAFDTGHLWFARQLVEEGILPHPVLVQLCMGVPWGAPDDLNTLLAMVNNVPASWHWSAFSLGAHQLPYVCAAVLAGGNVRVGLEDNLFLGRGRLATNAALVERAAKLIEGMGSRVLTAQEVRVKLGLQKRMPLN